MRGLAADPRAEALYTGTVWSAVKGGKRVPCREEREVAPWGAPSGLARVEVRGAEVADPLDNSLAVLGGRGVLCLVLQGCHGLLQCFRVRHPVGGGSRDFFCGRFQSGVEVSSGDFARSKLGLVIGWLHLHPGRDEFGVEGAGVGEWEFGDAKERIDRHEVFQGPKGGNPRAGRTGGGKNRICRWLS